MSDSSLQLAQQLQQVLTGLAASLGPCAPNLSLQRLSDCFCSTLIALISLHGSQRTSLFTVSAGQCSHFSSRPKGCTLLATPATYSSRVCHEIQNDRAMARRHWSLVWRVETASLSLKHLLQSSPNRLQHKNRTHITLVMRAQLHLHALFLPWKSLPAASSRLALAAAPQIDLLQSSPNRLQHKNRTHITLVMRAQLHLHALFFPWKSLPAASSRLALAAAKACTTSNISRR
jgi:hypothetical protein